MYSSRLTFPYSALLDSDDVQVDIDTYDDTDNQALRDTLQWEAVSNPSPADSTSTVTSKSHQMDLPRGRQVKSWPCSFLRCSLSWWYYKHIDAAFQEDKDKCPKGLRSM